MHHACEERSWDTAVGRIPMAVWATNRMLRITYAQASVLDVFGLEVSQLIGKPVDELFVGATELAVARHRLAIEGQSQSFRWSTRERCLDVLIEALQDERGQIIGCVGTAVDLTALARPEQELADSRRRLEEAQEVAHVGSFEWDVAANVVSWSDEMLRIYGVDKNTFTGKYETFLSYVHPEDRQHTEAVIATALRARRPFEYDHRIIAADGSIRNLHTQGDVIVDASGDPVRIVGSCWDATPLVGAKVGLENSLSLLEATINATADGLLVVDLNGKVTAYNHTFLSLWRIPEAVAARRNDGELLAAVLDQLEDPERFVRGVREVYSEPEQRSFDVLTFKDGRVFERFSAPQRLETRVVGRVWSFRDVTERARAERQATEAINILAIAAHDVRNPLGGLTLQLDVMAKVMAESTPAPQSVRDQIATCRRFVTRASALLSGLLDVTQIGAGKVTLHIESVDLVRLTRDVVARADGELASARCEVVVRADAAVEGRWDLGRVDQIVTNLLSNAIKYGRGKAIEIEVRSATAGCTWMIRDHGIGMSTDTQRRMFNQFERGVVAGQGVGLGLWIVRRLVAALGGRVEVQSKEAEGSTFTVTLPPSSPG